MYAKVRFFIVLLIALWMTVMTVNAAPGFVFSNYADDEGSGIGKLKHAAKDVAAVLKGGYDVAKDFIQQLH
ncbi:unnamed protein product [Callosobruchus maculatus]|uniref:Uncharacterized protein n=1 Tax=Callosobruchus maculatus TaxID=64391 RepID=A0A653DPF9_CALMS|nr:unnamed protein product [Callosobruchus maculatus]